MGGGSLGLLRFFWNRLLTGQHLANSGEGQLKKPPCNNPPAYQLLFYKAQFLGFLSAHHLFSDTVQDTFSLKLIVLKTEISWFSRAPPSSWNTYMIFWVWTGLGLKFLSELESDLVVCHASTSFYWSEPVSLVFATTATEAAKNPWLPSLANRQYLFLIAQLYFSSRPTIL